MFVFSKDSPQRRIVARLAALLCTVALIPIPVRAQDVYTDIEPAPLTMPGEPTVEIAQNDAPLPVAAEDAPPTVEVSGDGTGVSSSPKRFHYALRLNVRSVYDDNIFLTHSNRKDGVYFAIEPGITLGFGDIVGRQENYIRFDYAPSVFLFTNDSDANALQQLFRIEGQYRIARLAISLSQDIQILQGANLNATSSTSPGTPAINLDAGGQTSVNVYSTHLNLAYDLTGKTSLSGGVLFDAHQYEDLISSESISGNLFVNFNYSPKLLIGFGGHVGYNWVSDDSPNQTFEQVNARVNYQATGKLNLSASGGVEFRQFDGARGGYTAPVYDVGLTYQPFDSTNVTLRGSSRTQNSAVFLAQDFSATSITAGITQRFFQRVYVGVSAGYENDEYFGTEKGISAPRSDNYFFVQPAVDVTVTRFLSAGVYYLHRNNDSSVPSFGFYDNQVGLRASLTF